MHNVAGGLPQIAGGTVVTVGTFDGVHRGHQEILRRAVERGASLGLPAVLVTFTPHPLTVVNPGVAPMLLTPGDEQLEALVETGVEHVVVFPFTPTLAGYGAAEFVEHLLIAHYRARVVVMGYNHRLGRGREGDATMLAALGARFGFEVEIVPPALDADGSPISSSRIRRAIDHGDLAAASSALGRQYGVRGTVGHGSQRGRELGFPTLNIELPSVYKLLPPDGVYAVRVTSPRGTFGGMMNLGPRPTFGELSRTIEVHLFDAGGDWYGVPVSVELVRRLRDTTRFANVEALVAQLGRDADSARLALTQA